MGLDDSLMPLASMDEYDDIFVKIREFHDKYSERCKRNLNIVSHGLTLRQWCLLVALMQVAYKTTIPNSSSLKIFMAKSIGTIESAYKGDPASFERLVSDYNYLFQQFIDTVYDVLPHITDGLKHFTVALINFTNFDNASIKRIGNVDINMNFFNKTNSLTFCGSYDIYDVESAVRICEKLDGGAKLVNFTASLNKLVKQFYNVPNVDRSFNFEYYKRFLRPLPQRGNSNDIATKNYNKITKNIVSGLLNSMQQFANSNNYDVQTFADNLAKFYGTINVSENYYNMLVASEQLFDFNSKFYKNITNYPSDIWKTMLFSNNNNRFSPINEYCDNVETLFNTFYNNFLKPNSRFTTISYGSIIKTYDLRKFSTINTEFKYDLSLRADIPTILTILNTGIKGIADAYGWNAASIICGCTLESLYNLCEEYYVKLANKDKDFIKNNIFTSIINVPTNRVLYYIERKLNEFLSSKKLCLKNAKIDISNNIPARFMLALFFDILNNAHIAIVEYSSRKIKRNGFNINYDFSTFDTNIKDTFRNLFPSSFAKSKNFNVFWDSFMCELQGFYGNCNDIYNNAYYNTVIATEIIY